MPEFAGSSDIAEVHKMEKSILNVNTLCPKVLGDAHTPRVEAENVSRIMLSSNDRPFLLHAFFRILLENAGVAPSRYRDDVPFFAKNIEAEKGPLYHLFLASFRKSHCALASEHGTTLAVVWMAAVGAYSGQRHVCTSGCIPR